jgi:hypothetical protein
MIYLASLPVDDPLRNKPLGSFQRVEYRWVGGKTFRECKPTFGIARCTYNQLGPVWTTWDEWRILE